MNPLAITIIAISAWIAAQRSKKKAAEAEGWDEEVVEPEPAGVEHTDLDPCFLPKVPGNTAGTWLEGGEQLCPIPANVEPKPSGVTFAEGLPLHWPVRRRHGKSDLKVSYWDAQGKIHGRWGREFLAKRTNRKTGAERFHVGIDLTGARLDKVIAMESGTVVAILPNYLPPTDAIMVENDSGDVVLYGEIEKASYLPLGVGDRVEAGQAIAKVGAHEMLHVETYKKGATDNRQWHKGEAAPADLLDPSRYLIFAAIAEKNKVA